MHNTFEKAYDREYGNVRTVFQTYIEDDGWNPPREVIEELVFELKQRYIDEWRRIDGEYQRHKGEWITYEIMQSYSARAWIYRELYSYQFIREVRAFGLELMEKYGLCEIEAVNIVLGNEGRFRDYACKYDRIRNRIPHGVDTKKVYNEYFDDHADLYRQYKVGVS